MLTRTLLLACALGLSGCAGIGHPLCTLDIRRAVVESDAGHVAQARIKTLSDIDQADISARQAKLNETKASLDAAEGKMTQQKYQDLDADYQRQSAALSTRQNTLAQQMRSAQAMEEGAVLNRLHLVVDRISRARGCSAVITTQALVMPSPQTDITAEAIKGMNGARKP